jgi:hypothetical protein
MKVNLYGHTCMQKFGVPLQVTYDGLENNEKALNFEVSNSNSVYTSQTLWKYYRCYSALGVLRTSPLKGISPRDYEGRGVLGK